MVLNQGLRQAGLVRRRAAGRALRVGTWAAHTARRINRGTFRRADPSRTWPAVSLHTAGPDDPARTALSALPARTSVLGTAAMGSVPSRLHSHRIRLNVDSVGSVS